MPAELEARFVPHSFLRTHFKSNQTLGEVGARFRYSATISATSFFSGIRGLAPRSKSRTDLLPKSTHVARSCAT